MFAAEYVYQRQKRKSVENGRKELVLDQRQWRTDEPGPSAGVDLPITRGVYAQNTAYLELCNPGWEMQWQATFGTAGVMIFGLFLMWAWYGFAVHPLLFGEVIYFVAISDRRADWGDLLFGWLLFFPLALTGAALIYGWFFGMGMRACWFTSVRGRIRFNRLTRKVYVLRPGFCGGNKVF